MEVAGLNSGLGMGAVVDLLDGLLMLLRIGHGMVCMTYLETCL